MAVRQSAATGNLNAGATWVGGVAPGTGDDAWINAGHVVTLTAAPQVHNITLNGGSLVMNYDVTFDDTAGAGLVIKNVNSGGFSSNGAANAWRTMKSATVDNPANPWTISVEAITGTDSRSLDFRFVEFLGNKFYLGNSSYPANLNDPALKEYLICENETPPMRESALAENPIKGRTSGRIYQGYFSAASMPISGSCKYVSGFNFTVDSIQKSGQRISFFGNRYHLPKCKIDGKPIFTPHKGNYLLWNMVLREDI